MGVCMHVVSFPSQDSAFSNVFAALAAGPMLRKGSRSFSAAVSPSEASSFGL
jgi:hypothetical protein